MIAKEKSRNNIAEYFKKFIGFFKKTEDLNKNKND